MFQLQSLIMEFQKLEENVSIVSVNFRASLNISGLVRINVTGERRKWGGVDDYILQIS